tara:strand:+ start:137 stop:1429 length:1293 start_codon:yes stop_codon:yes gene_type:complete
MGASSNNVSMVSTAAKEVAAAGKSFRAPGIGQTLKDVGSDLKGMVDDTFGSGLKDTVGNLKDTVTDIPLSPGYSIEELGKDLGSFSKDGLTNALENITGVNLSNMIPSGSQLVGMVKGQISGTLNALQSEIVAEIQGCIENYLRELLNKVPELVYLLNFKKEVAKLIAAQRIKLQRMIQGQLEKLAFQKLQVQQIALLKQKLVGSIRGICKGAPGSAVRNYQSNPMAVVDTAKKNAGKLAEQVQSSAEKQAVDGYDNTTSGDLVDKKADSKASKPQAEIPSREILQERLAETKAELAKWEGGYVLWPTRRTTKYHATRNPADKRTPYIISMEFDVSQYDTANYKNWSEDLKNKKVYPYRVFIGFTNRQEDITSQVYEGFGGSPLGVIVTNFQLWHINGYLKPRISKLEKQLSSSLREAVRKNPTGHLRKI